jgi:predicted NBD/HSP70 family sugar kinase
VTTSLENDANAVAMGEKLFGDAKKMDNFTIVILADSIGAGHFVRGELYPGASGGAGEIGHCTIQADGLPCRCGKVGCLDTISGREAMVKLAQQCSLKVTSVRDLERLAAGGNAHATEILRRAGQAAGLAVSYIIQTNNPEMVLFAFTEDIAGGLFLTTIRQTVENNVLPRFLPVTQLLFQKVTESFWAKGAASIAAHDFYRNRVSS